MVFSGGVIGVLIVSCSVIGSLLMVLLVRRIFSPVALRQAHEVTGTLMTIVGGFYAVLLGMIVVDSLVRFEKALDGVQAESNSVADIFLLAKQLPEPYRSDLRSRCRDYVEEVVEHEWPLMKEGKVSMAARRGAIGISQCLDEFEPSTESEKAVYPIIIGLTQELWHQRRDRSNTVEYGMSGIEWFVLVTGCVITVFFVGLFAVESQSLQLLVTGLTTLVISLNIYLVYLFGYPFSGECTVTDRPFRIDVEIFDGVYDRTPAHPSEMDKDEAPEPPVEEVIHDRTGGGAAGGRIPLETPPRDNRGVSRMAAATSSGGILIHSVPPIEPLASPPGPGRGATFRSRPSGHRAARRPSARIVAARGSVTGSTASPHRSSAPGG